MSDFCVCNTAITSEPYFGMLTVDAEEIVYFDATHDDCLGEWGLSRYPDDPLGLRHCAVDEPQPEPLVEQYDNATVTVRLYRYLGGML